MTIIPNSHKQEGLEVARSKGGVISWLHSFYFFSNSYGG